MLPPSNIQTHMQSHDKGLPVSNCALRTLYRRLQSSTAAQIPSSTSSGPPLSRVVSRPITERNSRKSPVANPPYHFNQISSFAVQSSSRTCEWIKDGGTRCGAQITRATVSEHLTTHGVKGLAYNRLISCGWLGCQLRGGKGKMKRESIVRHVREKHLHYRRAL